jgi:hypothetical protein
LAPPATPDHFPGNPEHHFVIHAAPEGVDAMQDDTNVAGRIRAAMADAI